MRYRHSPVEYKPLSNDEKMDAISKLEEKTVYEDQLYRKFLFLIGVGFALVSIWVTWMIERMAKFSTFGLSMNVLVGILFLHAAWRNLYHREGKIKRTIQISHDPKELRARRDLLVSVQDMKHNLKMERGGFLEKKLNEIQNSLREEKQTKFEKMIKYNDLLESGVILVLNWTPAILVGFGRLVGASHQEWIYEIIFPVILGVYSIMCEYVLIFINENYYEINTLYQMMHETTGN